MVTPKVGTLARSKNTFQVAIFSLLSSVPGAGGGGPHEGNVVLLKKWKPILRRSI